MNDNNREYKEMVLNTSILEVSREVYQRRFSYRRSRAIAKEFDEHVANEPKVSFRDGKYYVFDGQHTIAARKIRNGGEDLDVKCKVYFDMTAQEEALLFAQQTGVSAPLTSGSHMRALIAGDDATAMAFKAATEAVGVNLDYDQERGKNRLGCIRTAFNAYKRMGEEKYREAMEIVATAWDGEPDSFRSENVTAITHFVELYHGEYDRQRLISNLRRVDPMTIYREGRAVGLNLAGYKRYLYQVYRIYNGNGSKRTALPLRF